MKKVLTIVLAALLLVACNEAKHVSGEHFLREYEMRETQTLVAAKYLGEKDGRVFLSRKTKSLVGGGWKEEIWFTTTEELDPEFLKSIRKEEVPNNGPSVQMTRDVQQSEKDHRAGSSAPQP